jgi:hypothetical protein
MVGRGLLLRRHSGDATKNPAAAGCWFSLFVDRDQVCHRTAVKTVLRSGLVLKLKHQETAGQTASAEKLSPAEIICE